MAAGVYGRKEFDKMPVLADALQDAGCEDPVLLGDLRENKPWYRGCKILDDLLGKRGGT